MNKFSKRIAAAAIALAGTAAATDAFAECSWVRADGTHKTTRIQASGAFKACAIQMGVDGLKNGQNATGEIRCSGQKCDAASGTFSYNNKTETTTITTDQGERFRVSIRSSILESQYNRYKAQGQGADLSGACTRTTTAGLRNLDRQYTSRSLQCN